MNATNLRGLLDYQKSAITRWENNNYSGIFEMAAGTGKTVTALAAASKVFSDRKELALFITVPLVPLSSAELPDRYTGGQRSSGYTPIHTL